MKIIVASHNRVKKVLRTLDFYTSNLFSETCKVVVLDGSSDNEAAQKIETFCARKNIKYIHNPVHFCDRIIDYCQTLDKDDIIAVSPDEDVYLPDFLADAEDFLRKNRTYSTIVGRYVTFQKPLGPLSRVSYARDAVTDYDINDVNPLLRATKLFSCILAGCPPVFWGVRSVENYLESCRFQKECVVGASMEVADQIILALRGKIKFSNDIMMLRDETKIGHKHSEEHHNLDTYITMDECIKLKSAAINSNYYNMKECVDMWCAIYEYNETNSRSILMQWSGGNRKIPEPLLGNSLEKTILALKYYSIRSVNVFFEILSAYIIVRSLKQRYGGEQIKNVLKKLSVA